MIDSIWAKLFIVLAVVGLIKWGHYTIDAGGYDRCTAENVTAINEAVEKDRKSEKDKQDKIDEETQKQFDAQRVINNQLNNDLDKLRKRTNRKQPSKKPESICKGTTGKSLSFEDAKFLTREAARADTIRAGLIGCYDYADTIK